MEAEVVEAQGEKPGVKALKVPQRQQQEEEGELGWGFGRRVGVLVWI
jgi:hypothetical protein